MQKLRYMAEALGVYVLYGLFKIMPAKIASNIGGWIGRTLGPKMAASRKAIRNLQRAMPDLTSEQQQKIITGVWGNLGRIMAEYPHLQSIARKNTIVEGAENLQSSHCIFIGAHLGNFELNGVATYILQDLKTDLTYRAPNNPYVETLLGNARTMKGTLQSHAKSRAGGRSMIKAAKEGHNLGILIDQKYNEGLAVPFFGIEAMTNPAFVQIAQKYNYKIHPIRSIRTQGTNFRLQINPPLQLHDEDGKNLPETDVILAANKVLEDWIREHPEQWLWLHRRWPD